MYGWIITPQGSQYLSTCSEVLYEVVAVRRRSVRVARARWSLSIATPPSAARRQEK